MRCHVDASNFPCLRPYLQHNVLFAFAPPRNNCSEPQHHRVPARERINELYRTDLLDRKTDIERVHLHSSQRSSEDNDRPISRIIQGWTLVEAVIGSSVHFQLRSLIHTVCHSPQHHQ
jgi:hypothetical protein